MSTCPFCNLDQTPGATAPNPPKGNSGKSKHAVSLLRRARRNMKWLLPAVPLVFIPKCPMCVVGYVALFTGIGITLSTARWLELVIPASCLISLAFLAVIHWRSRPKTHG